jgi:hypothetical protein
MAFVKVLLRLFIVITSFAGVIAHYRAKKKRENISPSKSNDGNEGLPPKAQ